MPAPTAEQVAIYQLAANTNQSLIVDAKAGSGKTTTLVEMLTQLKGTTSLQAFNRAIADELRARVAKLGFAIAMNVEVSTVHSHGLKSFTRTGAKPKVLSGKMNFMLKDQIERYPSTDPIHKNARHVAKLASYAKNAGFGLVSCQPTIEHFASIGDGSAWEDLVAHYNLDLELEGDFSPDDLISEAIDLLKASNARLNSIDYDDMIYLPLLLNMPISTYNNVLIDEAQDINSTRRELAFRSLKAGGRIIAVGDPNQAIYGFTGASTDSLDAIRRRVPDSVTLPLSICWRCDTAIIQAAQEYVPGIYPRPNAGPGSVTSVAFRSETEDFLSMPQPGDAILCRLNKPIVATALGLIRRGVVARIEGKDIGRRILDHVRRSTDLYAHQPLDVTLLDLDNYLESETRKLLAKNRESAIAMLEDEVDAAVMLIERCIESMGGGSQANNGFTKLEALAETLFADDIPPARVVTLSSAHKSKGREWKRVFILGRYDYMPFHLAVKRGGWQLDQEYNLIYVAYTRAEQELVLVTGVQAALDKGKHREKALATKEKTA